MNYIDETILELNVNIRQKRHNKTIVLPEASTVILNETEIESITDYEIDPTISDSISNLSSSTSIKSAIFDTSVSSTTDPPPKTMTSTIKPPPSFNCVFPFIYNVIFCLN